MGKRPTLSKCSLTRNQVRHAYLHVSGFGSQEGRATRDISTASCSAGQCSARFLETTLLMPGLRLSASLHPRGSFVLAGGLCTGPKARGQSAFILPMRYLGKKSPSVMQKAAQLCPRGCLEWVHNSFNLQKSRMLFRITSFEGNPLGISPSEKDQHCTTCAVKSQKVLPGEMIEQCLK